MNIAVFVSFVLLGQANHAPAVGPASGSLVIDGGGEVPPSRQKFVALAGGPGAEFVLIPTAHEDDSIDEQSEKEAFCRHFGVKDVTVLHTRDRAGSRHRGVRRSTQDGAGRLVRRRPAVAAGRRLHGHAHPARDRSRARPRRGGRRQLGRRDDPGVVPGPRCPRGQPRS